MSFIRRSRHNRARIRGAAVGRRRGSELRQPGDPKSRTKTTAVIFLRPRWMLFHLVVWALVATFVALGRWQLDVSNTKHFDFFNFQYAIQWWLFAAFGLFVWIRVMQHRLKPPSAGTSRGGGLVVRAANALEVRSGPTLLMTTSTTEEGSPALYRGYVIPQSSSTPVRSHGDSVHDAYNDYLWQLAASDGATPDVSAQLRAEAFEDEPTEPGGEPRPTNRELQ